ncbi:MAG: hypothetical protein J6R18_01280 [Kiritimatiellae bacterium]|nr:hypothetical protein [Kiritimatiellia bacterium]
MHRFIRKVSVAENASFDSSRTCIVWNDRIDLPSDAIYEYGHLQAWAWLV